MEEETRVGEICAKTAHSESPGSGHVTDCSHIIGQDDLPQGRLGNVVFLPVGGLATKKGGFNPHFHRSAPVIDFLCGGEDSEKLVPPSLPPPAQ